MPKEKLIVESRVKELLLAATKAKSVGQEVLDMLSDGVRTVAEQALCMCRVTPGGRLLLAEDDPAIPPLAAPSKSVERRLAVQCPERLCQRAKQALKDNGGERRGFPVAEDEMDDYFDWKYECSNGDTLLGFREWQEAKAEQLRDMTLVENEDKAARKGVDQKP